MKTAKLERRRVPWVAFLLAWATASASAAPRDGLISGIDQRFDEHRDIALLAEFDALPGITQTASPEREEIPGKVGGQACGHHLFGTASLGAAVAIKGWLAQNQLPGTIRVYGTPAEEGGSGKVYLVRAGLFDDVDAVLSWHPGSVNRADAAPSLANRSARFNFHGVSAHASAAPEKARSD